MEENLPAAHQGQDETPLFAALEPAGQAVQAVAPAAAEYLPAAQLVQLPPDSYWPAGQPAASSSLRAQLLEPEGAVWPEGHAVQAEAAAAA